MRTEDFIRTLSRDTQFERPVGVLLPLALGASTMLAATLFLNGIGIRADVAEAVTQANTLVKQGFPVLLAIGAFLLAVRLARPGGDPGVSLLVLGSVPVILVAALVIEMLVQPVSMWVGIVLSPYLWDCLVSIPVLSVPILAASLWALRRGASVRPGLTGAAAGLLSGGAAAAVYSFYCNQDSPLYFTLWYLLAIAAVTLAGALLGRRLLRW